MAQDGKMLLVLQFWEGDKTRAMDVARLIADMEPEKVSDTEFMFAARYDSSHDLKTVEHVSCKFPVHTFTCPRRASGWPFGCNELWFGTMTSIYERSKAKKLPTYSTILTFESDAAPLVVGWRAKLKQEWERCQAKVVGYLTKECGGVPHINGNAMFSGDLDFLRAIAKVGSCSPRQGWDFALAPKFEKLGWAGTPAIRSWWRKTVFSAKDYDHLVSTGCAFFHGVKGVSLTRTIRSKVFPDRKFARVVW